MAFHEISSQAGSKPGEVRPHHHWVVAAGTASLVIGGPPCQVRPDCGRSRIGHEQAERQKRTDCDVVVVHKILLSQW
jgi:hypothetical protein